MVMTHKGIYCGFYSPLGGVSSSLSAGGGGGGGAGSLTGGGGGGGGGSAPDVGGGGGGGAPDRSTTIQSKTLQKIKATITKLFSHDPQMYACMIVCV